MERLRLPIALLLAVLATLLARAAEPQGPPVQPASATPGGGTSESLEWHTGIPYCRGGGRPLLMDMLRPPDGAAPRPAVLFVHGGGWQSGSRREHYAARVLASGGFIAATLDYRLSDAAPFPAAVEDVKCAVRFLRAGAAQYGIDPQRIGIVGASAGGHLAMLAAVAEETAGLEGSGGWEGVSSRVQAVVSFYGWSDFPAGSEAIARNGSGAPAFLGGLFRDLPETYRRASPIAYVSAGDPPLLLLHGDRDRMVPLDQSERMLQAYRQAGLPAELVIVQGAGHGLVSASGAPLTPSRQEVEALVVDFFRKHL